MHITHVQGIFSPEHGGPAHSLTNYCVGQAKRGHHVSAWVLEGFPETSPAIRLPPPVETVAHRVHFPFALGRSSSMRRALSCAESPDVFHLHGTWLRAMHYGAEEARLRRVPYVVEPMGMYESYGLRTKWLRKRLARWWFQDKLLERAQCLQVNSRREGEQLRQLGFRNPLAVIPVGVDTAAIFNRPVASTPWPELNGRFFLFLSRIQEKKGIELLLNAWATLAAASPDWTLVIGGTGSPQYVSHCRQLADHLGIAARCKWVGHLTEAEKSWALSHADFFILPSFSENLGNVVAEALAHGTPVITTDATPWQEMTKRKCGWITSPTIQELTSVLEEAMRHDPTRLKEMGERGRQWCVSHFALERVLEDLDAVYGWLTGASAKPTCVVEA